MEDMVSKSVFVSDDIKRSQLYFLKIRTIWQVGPIPYKKVSRIACRPDLMFIAYLNEQRIDLFNMETGRPNLLNENSNKIV